MIAEATRSGAAPADNSHLWRWTAVVAIGALAILAVIQWRGIRSSSPSTTAAPLSMTALTSTGNAGLAQLSPDGKYVAYVQFDDGQTSVWVRQLASGSAVRIVAPAPDGIVWGLTIAPDSSFVDFVRSRSAASQQPMDLWRVPFLGGQARKIVDDVASAPGWSPDGTQMAYFTTPARGYRLMASKADGSDARVVASRTIPRRYMTLPFASRPDTRPVWFPDGRAIAVLGSDDQRGVVSVKLTSIDVATGVETELRTIAFSPRGGMVLGRDAQSITINMAASGPSQVVTIGLRDGAMTPLTSDLATYAGVSAAGDAIVTSRGQTNTGLWLLDAAGHNPRQIGRDFPSGFIGLSWAGNARLVFNAALAGGGGVWSTDVAGTSDLVVPDGILPSASADGRTMVFFRGAGGGELWRADTDGRHAARMTGGVSPQIAPDGSRMFYISGQSGAQTVWVVDLAGGQPRQVAPMTALTVSEPAVSPDGRQVVFISEGAAVVMPVDGGEPIRRIPMPATRLRWTPDGHGLTYADATSANLWVQPIDAGAPRQLTTFPDDGKRIANFAWSPDGQQLAVARSVTTSDVVLLKSVR